MKTAIKYFFVWIGWMFLGALLMLFPAMILGFAINGGHIGELFDNPWTFSLIMVGSQVLPIYVFWRSKYANFSIHKSLNNVKLYLWMALAAIGVIFFNGIMESYLPFAEMEMEDLEFLDVMMKNPIGIVSACILAPLAEEAVFRGAIERSLLDRGWKPWLAILVSTLFFSVAHFNLTQGTATIIAGALLGWVYYRTRNLWPCVFVHAVNNTIATVANFIPEESVMESSLPVDLAWTAGAIALFCFAIYRFNRQTEPHLQQVLAEQQLLAEQQAEAEQQAFYELNRISEPHPVPPPFPQSQQHDDNLLAEMERNDVE